MSSEIEVGIYYGPHWWFKEQLGDRDYENLLDIAHDQQEQQSNFSVDGLVIAESEDFATFTEHTITNFLGFVRLVNPDQILLHNPPSQVVDQMRRSFKVDEQRYKYPVVTAEILRDFNAGFEDHLVGQEHVRDRILAALYPLTKSSHPKPVVLMFYGPSGVGKTETAQFVNGLLGGELLRKQFSMFQSEKFASYLFGGKHSEASFARDLQNRDSGVILLDEFDKAHQTFHSAFYQVFDDGTFEDKNYSAMIGPAVIICTSNYESEDEIQKTLGDALSSRFDALIGFKHLSRDGLIEVVGRIYDKRRDLLSTEERAQVDEHGLRSKLLVGLADQPDNIRRVSKIIDEAIATVLVRHLMSTNEP